MGEVFAGRYELVDPIGSGGMGTVWRVRDHRTGALVAPKVLRQSDAADLLRFVREQAVRVHHPHIVVPLGWAGEDDRLLLTMPIVAGGSLATLVGDHGALPPLFVAEVLRQLADALAAVHAAGFVHRDVKPANVLLDATGTGRPLAWRSDFGIAVELTGPRLTRTGLVYGTPGYLAPEAGSEPSVAADLYALGQVAATMLTGLPPGSRPAQPAPAPDAAAATLWRLVDRLCAPRPEDRPASAAEVRAALDAPELGWRPEGVGEVEVFDQLPPLPGAEDEPATTADALAPTVVRASSTPVLPVAAAVAPRRSRRAVALVVAAAVLALAVGVLLLWRPWDAAAPHAVPLAPPSGAAPATAQAAPATPATQATPTPTTPAPATPATSVAPGGKVTVGTVVASVGQPCAAGEAGQRETTTDGVAVVCTADAAGGYAWRAA